MGLSSTQPGPIDQRIIVWSFVFWSLHLETNSLVSIKLKFVLTSIDLSGLTIFDYCVVLEQQEIIEKYFWCMVINIIYIY